MPIAVWAAVLEVFPGASGRGVVAGDFASGVPARVAACSVAARAAVDATMPLAGSSDEEAWRERGSDGGSAPGGAAKHSSDPPAKWRTLAKAARIHP